jgi:hypothetical protein
VPDSTNSPKPAGHSSRPRRQLGAVDDSGSRCPQGRGITIQNKDVTIVGVLPAGFYPETAVWQARQFSALMVDRRGSGTPVIARLRPGVTLAQARIALDAVTTPGRIQGPEQSPAQVVVQSMYDDDQPVGRDDQHAGAGGRPDPDHRLRQRRWPPAGTRRDARRRARHSRGDRRRARPAGAPAAHRERDPGACRRVGWCCSPTSRSTRWWRSSRCLFPPTHWSASTRLCSRSP